MIKGAALFFKTKIFHLLVSITSFVSLFIELLRGGQK